MPEIPLQIGEAEIAKQDELKLIEKEQLKLEFKALIASLWEDMEAPAGLMRYLPVLNAVFLVVILLVVIFKH